MFFVLCVRQSSRSGVQSPRPGCAWPKFSSILPRSPNFDFVSPCLNQALTVCGACTVLSINAMSACTHRKTNVSVRVPISLASACSRSRTVNNEGQGQGRLQAPSPRQFRREMWQPPPPPTTHRARQGHFGRVRGGYSEPERFLHSSMGSQRTLRTLRKQFSTCFQYLAQFLVDIRKSASCQLEF